MFRITFTTSALNDIVWFVKRERIIKTIKISPRSRIVNDLLKQALEENLIHRTDDGREFLLVEIDDFDREIELTRQNDELMRLLDARGREKATVGIEEARSRLGV
jgi:hypothetical protein